jgi:hypothetical protein
MTRKVAGKAELIKYWPSPLKEGMVVHIGHWMQMIPSRITGVDNGSDFRNPALTVEMESDMIHKPGDTGVMMYLEGGKLRIVGSIKME